MRKWLLLCILLQICCTVFGQGDKIDSLRYSLATSKVDTQRVLFMSRLSAAYLYSKPDTALTFAREGLTLARKIRFKKGEQLCLSNTGNIFFATGNYPLALAAQLEALKIAEERKAETSLGVISGNIANIYVAEGDFRRCIDYYLKAIAVYRDLKDSSRVLITIGNLGEAYEKMNRFDSAILYTRMSYTMASLQHDDAGESYSLNNLGNVFNKLRKPDSANHYYRLAIPIAKQLNLDPVLAESFLGVAKIFQLQNRKDSSLYYAKLSYAIAKRDGFTDELLEASTFLTDYYKSVQNIDSAFAYQAATIAAKDSLFSQQKASQVQSMTYDEAARQQQIEDAKQQERTRAKQNALIGGLVALVIVACLLVRNNRSKRKANQLLLRQKKEIDKKAQELSLQKENLQEAYNNVEQLGEIGRKITSSLSVEKIIGTVYDNVNHLMDAAVFGIGIYNENLKRLEFPATYENGEQLPFYTNDINDKNRFGAICFTMAEEITIGNLADEHKNYVQQVVTPHQGGQPVSIIFLPLVAKEKKLGVITVQSFKENAYSDYHLFMLRNIGTYTAIAIENAEAFETLNQTYQTLQSTQLQLIQSEKMASLGELTAGIAHEIQNPLNFVNNFSELNNELIEELKNEKVELRSNEQDELLNDIFQNNEKIAFHGKRADAIVKGMLQHSRTSAGRKEATDINALVDEYLRLAYHGLQAKDKGFNAQLVTEFDAGIDNIEVVPQELGRALLNIFNNAFYAVNEKEKEGKEPYEATIWVSTKKAGNQIMICIKDNGIGISQNLLDKIFQPFFTTKPTGQGTGLGLSLSYDIIKAHRAEIKVETKEGEGSLFIIRLPIS